jgi:acyl-CoA synthetase (AMP-forming)/AMP-acid ligase II
MKCDTDNFASYLFDTGANGNKIFSLSKKSSLTHGNLREKVEQNSKSLEEIFVTKQLIAIYIPNSAEFIVTYLSVLKSGHAAVVLDTSQPIREHISLIEKHCISTVITTRKYLDKFENVSYKKFLLLNAEYLNDIVVDDDAIIERQDVDPSLALIIFSSGSTGKEKGVMLSHGNLISNTDSIIKYLKLNSQDRMNVVLPFSYSYGLSLLHTHLKVGGSVYLHASPFIGSVIHELNEFECTGLAGVPSTFITLINKTPFLETSYTSLRYLTQAGGKLPADYIKRIVERLTRIQLFIMYGTTEASPRLSYLPPEYAHLKPNSIGIPIPGVKLEISKSTNEDDNKHGEGEIVASGDNIMTGYLDDPIGTRRVLKNGKLYTGDLGRVDSDGYFYCLRRKNRVVKSMGYRVSLDSIEQTILSSPVVNNVCVVNIDHTLYGESLGAIIEAKGGISIEICEGILDQFFSRELASYEIPDPYIIVNSMPMKSSGKSDVKLIREMLNDAE